MIREYDDPVKRAIFIVAMVLVSGALFAQVHGPGASVLSSGRGSAPVGGKSVVTGPAASVLSTGPRGWQVGPCMSPTCVDHTFMPTVNYQTGTVEFNRYFITGNGGHGGKGGHHRPGNGGGYYYGYGYGYPVYVPVPVEPEPVPEEQPEPPAVTVFENRPVTKLAPNPTPVQGTPSGEPSDSALSANETAGHHQMSPVSEEQIPMVLVFKDGHEQEIKNYAIVGDTLYDIGTFVAHKIKLGDLDLQQTIKKNEDRGVEFNLPAGAKPVG